MKQLIYINMLLALIACSSNNQNTNVSEEYEEYEGYEGYEEDSLIMEETLENDLVLIRETNATIDADFLEDLFSAYFPCLYTFAHQDFSNKFGIIPNNIAKEQKRIIDMPQSDNDIIFISNSFKLGYHLYFAYCDEIDNRSYIHLKHEVIPLVTIDTIYWNNNSDTLWVVGTEDGINEKTVKFFSVMGNSHGDIVMQFK